MPKAKGKGGKGKRKGKRFRRGDGEKRELRTKGDSEAYGKVLKVLGNCRFTILCYDGKERLGHARGKFKKRVWFQKDDIVLVGIREFQDAKCDIMWKYTPEEIRLLARRNEIPPDAAENEDIGSGSEDEDEFEDEDTHAITTIDDPLAGIDDTPSFSSEGDEDSSEDEDDDDSEDTDSGYGW